MKVIFFEFIPTKYSIWNNEIFIRFDQTKQNKSDFLRFYSNKNNFRKTKSIFRKRHQFFVESVSMVDEEDYSVSKDQDCSENRNPSDNAIANRFVEVRPSPKRKSIVDRNQEE